MPMFLLHHRHKPDECAAVFAAWKTFDSPLSHRPVTSSCRSGGHEIWWEIDNVTQTDALAQLPRYVADRTVVVRVDEVEIP
jgi:hypothetical protein